jgi:hypothetical protein
MRKGGIALGLILGGIALLVAIYEFGYTHRYRYRLTVEVEVDGQVKSGSGVVQVISRLDFVPGRPLKYTTTFSGEAVYVDLAPRGNLFALLAAPDGFDAGYMPSKVFFRYPTSASREEHERRFEELNRLVKTRAQVELRPEQLPMLVTFKHLNDPKSVVWVYPTDLAAAFGQGVRLRRATIQMTDDPVTTGIENKLPWIVTIRGYLDGRTVSPKTTAANSLSSADFKWNL